jgi:CheY-like chemotaxis protein
MASKPSTSLRTEKAPSIFSSPVDFIISDWDMPRLGGLELLRAIRNKPVFKSVPFLIVNDDEDPGSVTEAEECGADGHLPKPFTQNLVETRVQEITETWASLLPFHTLISRASAFADIGAVEDVSKELSDLCNTNPKTRASGSRTT